MKTVTATLKDGRTVEYLPQMIGEGGMKQVYFTTDHKSVVCFFKDKSQASDPNRMARLEAIVGKYNPTTNAAVGKYFSELFCWPTGIIVQPELGVITPAYSSNFFFGSGNWKGKEKEGRWFSSPKLRKLLPAAERGQWFNYLQLCTLMSRAIRKMHLTGLAHSDLSCKNVLVDPPGGRCAVIDIDSLVVPGVYPPDVLGTPGYIAPEVLATQHLDLQDKSRKLPSNFTDLHALAVLIYEYLLKRHPLRGPKVNGKTAEEDERLSMGEKALFIENPRDTSNRPKVMPVTCEQLGPYLSALFHKAFGEGLHNPQARPSANEWETALYKSADLFIQCGNAACDDKGFIFRDGQKAKCPTCGWSMPAPLPLLEFHFSPGKGVFRPEGHGLIGWENRPLKKWHIFRNVKPVEGADEEVQAIVMKQQGHWILVNKNLDSLLSPSGNPVPKGQGCLLKEGSEVRLSKDEHGRLITIKMIQ